MTGLRMPSFSPPPPPAFRRHSAGGVMIRRRNFARTLTAAFLLAAATALFILLSSPAPGHAQTADTTLVSNTAQTPRGCSDDVNNFGAAAQEFTTGSHSSGYDLTSVSLYGGSAQSSVPLTVTLRAKLSGEPSSDSLATFTKPSSWVAGDNEFPAPSGTHLTADTTYFIHAAPTASIIWCYVETLSTSAASSGWSLGRLQDDDGGWTDYGSDLAYIIAIKGTAAAAQTGSVVWEATLTAPTAWGNDGTTYEGYGSSASPAIILNHGTLTPDSFTFESTTHTVELLAYTTGSPRLYFFTDTGAARADLAGLSLIITVDGAAKTLAVSDAVNAVAGGTTYGIYWASSDHGYSSGDWAGKTVTVQLWSPNNLATGAPAISGTATVGQTLTASTSDIADSDGLTSPTYSYQWVRVDGSAESDISGATSSTYTLVADDEGKTIKVTVSFTDDASNAETLTSAATGTVAAADDCAGDTTSTCSVSPGTPVTGDIESLGDRDYFSLSVTSGVAYRIDAEGQVTFKGTLADPAIELRDSANVRLTRDDDGGDGANARLTWTADTTTTVYVVILGYNDAQTGTYTLTVSVTNYLATGAPTISGTAQVGETLTAATSGIADTDGLTSVSYTYQWVRVDGATESDISGATDSTYTLVAADLGKTIKVKVSFTDDNSNAETLTSAATGTVAAAATTTYISNLNQGADNKDDSSLVRAQPFSTGSQTGGYVVTHVDIGSDDDEGDSFSAAIYTTNASGHPVSEFAALIPPSSFAKGALTFTAPANTTLAASTTYTVRIVKSSGATLKLDTTTANSEDAGGATGWSIGNVAHHQQSGGSWSGLAGDAAIRIAVKYTPPATNNAATGAPTISGTAQVGETLTAATSGIADSDGLTSPPYVYRWIRVDGATEAGIPGATSSAYTLVDADEGKTIKVRVSFTDDNSNPETLTSAATAAVAAADDCADDATTTCSVSPGSSVTGDIETNEDDDVFSLSVTSGVTYQIDAEGSPTSKGTLADPYLQLYDSTSTLIGSNDDYGNSLNSRLTWTAGSTGTVYVAIYSARGGDTGTYTLTVSVTNYAATGAPTISGTPQVGETLTAATSGIMDSDGLTSVSYTYQWVRVNGTESDISGATDSTYTLVDADEGKTIKVTVSFTDDNSNAETLTSTATVTVTAAANNLATGTAAISGTATVGQTLSATIGSIADADGLTNASFTYQWVRVDGSVESDISGATASTYTLVAADAGKTIKVKISFTDDLGNSETRTSAATATVAAAVPGAPLNLSATAGDGAVMFTWGEPPNNGAPITAYRIRYKVSAASAWEDWVTVPTLSATVTGLTNATSYDFEVQAQNSAGWSASAEVSATPVAPPNNPATGAPTISGTAQVGETLTAATGDIMDSDGLTSVSYTYQWVRVNGTEADISGATGSTYTLVAADEGKTIKVRVSFTDDGNNAETLTSAATVAVTSAANNLATGAPTISGTAQVGETLTADTGSIADADGLTSVSYTYQWVRVDGSTESDISGATSSTYTLVAADEGKTIKVRVSFTDDNSNAETLTSAATAAVAAADDCAGDATSSNVFGVTCSVSPGTPVTGDIEVAADGDYFSLAVTSGVTYRIDAEGAETSKGTLPDPNLLLLDSSNTLLVFNDDYAGDLNSRVDWTASSTETVYIYINSAVVDGTGTYTLTVTVTNYPATGAPTISGTAQVGETLTAATSGIMDSDGLASPTYTYQWVRVNGTEADISGATSSTYTLVDADEGKTIKVKVSFTDDNSNAETLTSAATVAVTAAANTPATGAPTISGTAQVGETLTAATGDIMDSDGLTSPTYTYQWVRVKGTDADIPGATSSTYTLVAADRGKTIKVKVSFTDDEGNAETLTSAATTAVAAAPNTPATGAPTISGTAQVGETLTAATSGIADTDGLTSPTYAYQWVRVDGSAEADISGATAMTYTLVADDEGKTIKVKVSFADDASNAETLTSAATVAVTAAANNPATGAPTISGTAQVGQTLTAATGGIMDSDGLTTSTYTYQWVRVDGSTETDIPGTTSSAYTLVAADEGKTIKVKVSFTDDAGNDETLTITTTAAVRAAAVPDAPLNLRARPGNEEVALIWGEPPDNGAAITGYRTRFKVSTATAWEDWVTVTTLSATVSDLTNDTRYDFEVQAQNSAGWSASAAIRATPVASTSALPRAAGPDDCYPERCLRSLDMRNFDWGRTVEPSGEIVYPVRPDVRGIWSDGNTFYVIDKEYEEEVITDGWSLIEGKGYGKVVAFELKADLRGFERREESGFELDRANINATGGFWGNNTTVWVADDAYWARDGFYPDDDDRAAGWVAKLFAYNRSDGSRAAGEDFTTLAAAGNDHPAGIWSDGTTMWVADSQDGKLYAYKMSDRSRDAGKDFPLWKMPSDLEWAQGAGPSRRARSGRALAASGPTARPCGWPGTSPRATPTSLPTR